MFKSSNPVFNSIEKTSTQTGQTYVEVDTNEKTASWRGITIKTMILLLTAIAFGFSSILFIDIPAVLIAAFLISFIGSFIIVFIAMRSPKHAMWLSIVYAIAQGLTYGALTWLLEFVLADVMPGIGIMAVTGTFVVVLTMAGLYRIGAVRATPFLVKFVLGSLVAILIASLISFILSILGISFLQGFNPAVGIAISGFFILLGALMLILDFERAKLLVEYNSPVNTEWQAALGILITTVWIYVNILKFLLYIAARRK